MQYKDAKTWLNEEYRKSIRIALEAGSKKEVMSYVDALCNQYLEMKQCALIYERMLTKEQLGSMSAIDICNEINDAKCYDFDKLESPFTDKQRCEMDELVYDLLDPETRILCPMAFEEDGTDNIGSIVHKLRVKAKLSQEALAALAGTSKQTINSIEKEKTSPSVYLFLRIMEVLGEKTGYDLVIRK